MKAMKHCGSLLLCAALLAGVPCAAMVLVENGANPAPIYAPKRNADAAGYLADYLGRITGAKFTVNITNTPPAGRSIRIGYGDIPAVRVLDGDGFAIRVSSDRVSLDGATPRAVIFAVFALLEDRLGCRWWSRDEEDVPKLTTIKPVLGETIVKAPFTLCELLNWEAQTTRSQGLEFKLRSRSTQIASSEGHSNYKLLKEFAEQHPEIYPYDAKAKKRAPNQIHFCYSASNIVDGLVEALSREVRKHEGNLRDVIYIAGMGDAYGGECECERCKAIYLEEGWTDSDGKRRPIIGGTNLRMINSVAEKLDQRFPGIKVGTLAYMSMEAPPTVTSPRTNVYIRIPHLRHCIIHGVEQCRKNSGYLRNLKRWGELAPKRVIVWDYTVDFGENFLYPFPVVSSIAENIRAYDRLGVVGLTLQGNYVSFGGDLAVLKNYVWRRLLWDTSLNVTNLIGEFCAGYYGPAAGPVRGYVMELEGAVAPEAITNHLSEFAERADMRAAYLNRNRMEKLQGFLDEARKAAGGVEPYARRVEEAAVSLEAFRLWNVGPLAEKEGRLVREDLGGEYTFDRARRMLSFAREASAREWREYQIYHKILLTYHGGPVVALKKADIAVKVTPALGMRIRQIEFKGKPLLYVRPYDPKDKLYPNVGGCGEEAHYPWTAGEIEGQPTATSIVMQADAGSRGTPSQNARKSVTIGADGAIRIAAGTRLYPRQPGASTRGVMKMEYDVGSGMMDTFRIEILPGKGDWVQVHPAAAGSSNAWKYLVKEQSRKDREKKNLVTHSMALPAGIRGLRLHLEKPGCIVEELYGGGASPGGSIEFIRKEGVLVTAVKAREVAIEKETYTPWLDRTIRIRDLDPVPPAAATAAKVEVGQ